MLLLLNFFMWPLFLSLFFCLFSPLAPIMMHMPMSSFPLLTAFTSEVEAKTPLTVGLLLPPIKYNMNWIDHVRFKLTHHFTSFCIMNENISTLFQAKILKYSVHSHQKLQDTVSSMETQLKDLMQVCCTVFPVCRHIVNAVFWSCKKSYPLNLRSQRFEQNPQLPQFNETFLANLQSMKQHVNESEWTVELHTHLNGEDYKYDIIE